MASLILTTTASIPENTGITLTVHEDSTGNGSSDHSVQQVIDDGTNSYVLEEFNGSAGNDVWFVANFTTTNDEVGASLESVSILVESVGGIGFRLLGNSSSSREQRSRRYSYRKRF